MAVDNATIFGKIWLNGTSDFQQRIPNPTQAGVAQSFEKLFDYGNGRYLNQFLDSFVNLIGEQILRTREWENPLRVFKGSRLSYGSVIQEAAPKWIQAHAYDDEDLDLLRMARPEFAVWYHSVNRQDKYKITVNREELQAAARDEYGLNNLAQSIVGIPINSDNYDEFLLMKNLISEYDRRWGFYREQLSAAPTDEATGKELLTGLRAMANLLKFPTTQYNASDMDVPVFATSDELVLLIDAKTMASLDVNTLASVFNLDRADIQYRTVVLDSLPVEGACALLTTEDFFVVRDYVYETDSFYDPNTLNTHYFLHHWEVVSASPFVPAILFGTFDSTELPTVTQTVTGLTLATSADTVAMGGTVQLQPTLTGTLASSDASVDPAALGLAVEPDACTWTIAAQRQSPASGSGGGVSPVQLNSRTYVDRLGRLHCQKSGVQADDEITVTATSTYTNPDGTTQTYTATATVTVTAEEPEPDTMQNQIDALNARADYKR